MLGVMSGVCMARSWTCGRSVGSTSPGRAMLSQIGTVSGGLIWGLLVDLYWALQEPDGGFGGGEGVAGVSTCAALSMSAYAVEHKSVS